MKLRGCSIKFRNHFKQLVVSPKTYVDFECNVKGVKSNYKNNAFYTKKYQAHISSNFANQVVYIYDRFSKPIVLDREKNAFDKFIKAINKEYDYCKKKKKKIIIIKKRFDKILSCLQETEKDFNPVINVGFIITCLR